VINIASAWYDTFAGTADCCVVAEYDKMTDFIQHDAVETFTIWDDVVKTEQVFKFTLAGTISQIDGSDDANDDIIIKANSSDDYPYMKFFGAHQITLYSGDDIYFYEHATQMFKFSYTGNISSFKAGSAVGDDLYIYANSGEAYSQILLQGTGDIFINSGVTIWFKRQAGVIAQMSLENSGGVLSLDECTGAATPIANYGSIWTEADNEVHFMSGDGTEYILDKTAV